MKNIGYIGILLLAAAALASAEILNKNWWKNSIFYQIYPRSFKDSNGDGIGDLKGITSKLQHFKDTGIHAIWLSPINKSPMRDYGYDISDFKDVDPIFGNLADLDELIQEAHKLGLKVILDLVPNHTSDQHDWFKKSIKKEGVYADYYIWSDKKPGSETPEPPNNWVSVFNGSAWTWNEERQQYFFHQFYPEQPDLDYTNTKVQDEMKDIMKFWLDKGIDGFRIDAVPHLIENHRDQDEPRISGCTGDSHVCLNHTLTKDQPETYKLVESWRKFVDEYAKEKNQDEKVLLTEAYTSWENTIKYYNYGSHVPFNFKFIMEANGDSDVEVIKGIIDKWMLMTPMEFVANWVMGNHDRSRLATRYSGKADQMVMLEMILPGVAVTYYGEEIGMEDNSNANPDPNKAEFRDGCRTPFQWDNSTSAGFSTSQSTWLNVHPNYLTLNLANQKNAKESPYKLYKELVKLRSSTALRDGTLRTEILKDNVLAIVRKAENETVTLLINFSKSSNTTVNLSNLTKGNTKILLSNVGSGLTPNTTVNLIAVTIPKGTSMVLHSSHLSHSSASTASYSILCLLLAAIISFFRS